MPESSKSSSAAAFIGLQDYLYSLTEAADFPHLEQQIRRAAEKNFHCKVSLHFPRSDIVDHSRASGFVQGRVDWHTQTESQQAPVHSFDVESREYWVGLNLKINDSALGSIVLSRKNSDFVNSEIETLNEFVRLSSLALLPFFLQTRMKEEQKRLLLISHVLTQLAHILDLPTLANEVCRLIRENFGFYYVAVFTVEQYSNSVIFGASSSASSAGRPLFENLGNNQIKMGEHLVGFVAQSGKMLLANDVSKEPHYFALDSLPETEAELALPLKVGDEIVGVLDVQSNQINAFTPLDLRVLSSLADGIALAIHRVRLYHSLTVRNEQLDLISKVSKSITSILDKDQLLKTITDLLHHEFNYPYVHIFLVQYVSKKAEYKAGSGARAEAFRQKGIAYDISAVQGIIPMTIRTGKLQLINDVSKDPRFVPNPITHTCSGSELTIPLGMGANILGVLDIQSDQSNYFTQSDVDLLTTLSANISIALRNAALYDSQLWRRRVAENLRDVAVLLSDKVSLPDLYQVVLEKIQDILPADVASIWLLSDPTDQTIPSAQTTLSLTASRSTLTTKPISPETSITEKDAWFFEVLKNDAPLTHTSEMPGDPIARHYQFPPEYSAVAAPLSIGGRQLGVLVLHQESSGRFGEDSEGICATFAGYLANAIQNERLNQESLDQSWISTILLQVALASQFLTNPDELTEMIGKLILLLIGGKDGGLILFDRRDSTFSLSAVFDQEKSALTGNLPISLADVGNLPEIMASHQPVALPAGQFIAQISNLMKLERNDTVLLFPLVAHNEPVGVLMHISPECYLPDDPEHVLGKQRFAILKGIAQQTANSIQNLNLIEARQEETYISSTLLQFSNWFASTDELSVSLEKITHAIPILCGSEEVAILERNKEDETYFIRNFVSARLNPWQTQNLIGKTFPVSQLPIAQEFSQEKPFTIKPPQWMGGLISVLLNADEGPEYENGDTDTSSFLFFPLAVPGEEYGLLVIRDGNLPGRERRLEILQGAAQQISIAIQNNHLKFVQNQQNMAEREFQLARQIQKTFLPEKLPEISGYDLDVSWQTARQVGGDFYDVFQIKPGLFGLVIADVSDKGLAAALYMTVSRSLIRAIALETVSPKQTLERVNYLLQLDSKEGFFVTSFYGVLEQTTGKINYCCAGHNLPFLMKASTGTVVQLPKGGIALGIFEDISLTEHETFLNPGDSLMMYTDGVTESFDRNGKLYGTRRFQKLLKTLLKADAKEIITAVERDLDRFRAGSALTDDVTLMVVKRLELLTNQDGN